ncbi:Mannan synthase 1 [Vitis vinifera]|uniref:glucomannan 4-beta-mannosyltransferase n=1 Tax=Vitis vinifera TaxID=29760 RepID=A0A438J7G0_VITVI|nr:Mannan synthase 1 [Vitis vinifera]
MRNLVLQEPEVRVTDDVTSSLSYAWQCIRVPVIAPLLWFAIFVCAAMSIMLFIERVYMAIIILCVKVMRKKRYTKYKLDTMKEDLELNKSYPKVLIQIPMYNEKEVYKLSIGAACSVSWPSDRFIIQVLDDSTNEALRVMVELECRKWIDKGVNVKYETRNNRNGYKAGALREGLQKQYVEDCEFVAIFDADFQPEENFLWRTIPFLLENPGLGLVQARWKFVNTPLEELLLLSYSFWSCSLVNADECLMTRLQEMSLDYHFSVEQEVGSSTCSFFGFNGTAGVWRIQAINDAGGWKDRTTVEDMDLAVRASLKGWKFLFVGDLSKVSTWKKFHVIYAFFFVRKIIAHWVTFFFYCVVIPLSVLVPEVALPKPIAIYIPATITFLNAVCTPRSLHLVVFWILFENVMSLHRTKAAIIGLLEANRVNEWVVTEKLGNLMKQRMPKHQRNHDLEIHLLELIMGMFMLHCAIYNLLFREDHFFIYLILQAGAFFIMGFGYVGTFVSN